VARGASAPTEGGEGRGHIMVAARLQLVKNCFIVAASYPFLLA